MNLIAKIKVLILILMCSYSYGQMDQYSYKRELPGVTNQWHKVVLEEDIFGKISPDLSDIRIFGITATKDTIEASYLLKINTQKPVDKEVFFKLLNSTYNEKGYYFTLEVPKKEAINQLKLDFKQINFDWNITLEGSQNQQEWFTIVDDYRIVSISNAETNYQFTKVVFPSIKYHFFRLHIESPENPNLISVKASLNKMINGSYQNYSVSNVATTQNQEQKITTLEINLKYPVPVSYMKFDIKNTFDYYRPITISFVTDSILTEQGWKYSYQKLATGTLNSMEKNEFRFENTILKKLKININNHDNKPLTIQSISIKGNVYELIARFTEPATYFLTYGNKKVSHPEYDIERFSSKIPDTLAVLNLGKEQHIAKKENFLKEPLFKNKNWLWALMIIIILILGWFSIKMIKSKENT